MEGTCKARGWKEGTGEEPSASQSGSTSLVLNCNSPWMITILWDPVCIGIFLAVCLLSMYYIMGFLCICTWYMYTVLTILHGQMEGTKYLPHTTHAHMKNVPCTREKCTLTCRGTPRPPHSLTHASTVSHQVVACVTTVGGCLSECCSRVTNLAIGWIRQSITVHSYKNKEYTCMYSGADKILGTARAWNKKIIHEK